MATITFDTHKFIRRLQDAGFSPQQAEAVAEAFRDAQGEADLATKRDIEDLRRDMKEMELRLTIKLVDERSNFNSVKITQPLE